MNTWEPNISTYTIRRHPDRENSQPRDMTNHSIRKLAPRSMAARPKVGRCLFGALWFCAALALGAAVRTPAVGASVSPSALVIAHVTVIDVETGRTLPDMSVVVEGERIAQMGPAREVKIPKGAQVVDGAGKFLIPGLWDMHVH